MTVSKLNKTRSWNMIFLVKKLNQSKLTYLDARSCWGNDSNLCLEY